MLWRLFDSQVKCTEHDAMDFAKLFGIKCPNCDAEMKGSQRIEWHVTLAVRGIQHAKERDR